MALTGFPTVKVYYGKPMLPDVSRVLACLYEKDVEFKLIDIDHEDLQMPLDFLKVQLSPTSTRAPITVFEDGSTLLFDSRATCRYISEKHAERGNKNLLGRDLLERASVEQWLKSEEQSFHPPSWELVFHLAFAPLTHVKHVDRALLTHNEQRLARVLDVYEHRLSKSRFLAGNDFTLADLSHLPNSHYLANSEDYSYLFDSRKNVRRWFKKISTRPSWTKVVDLLNEVPILREPTEAKDGESTKTTLQLSPSISSGTQSSKVYYAPPSYKKASVEHFSPVVETTPDTATTQSTHPPSASKSSPAESAQPAAAPATSESTPRSTTDQQIHRVQSAPQIVQQGSEEVGKIVPSISVSPDQSTFDETTTRSMAAQSKVNFQRPAIDSTDQSIPLKPKAQPDPSPQTATQLAQTAPTTQSAPDQTLPARPTTPPKPAISPDGQADRTSPAREEDKIPSLTSQEAEIGATTGPTKTRRESDSSSQSIQIGSSTQSTAQQGQVMGRSQLSTQPPAADSTGPPSATLKRPTPKSDPSPQSNTSQPAPTAESPTQTPFDVVTSPASTTLKPTPKSDPNPKITTEQAQTAPTAQSPTQTTFDPPASTTLKPTPKSDPSPQVTTQQAQTAPPAQSPTQTTFDPPASTTLKPTPKSDPSPQVTTQQAQTAPPAQSPTQTTFDPPASTTLKPTPKSYPTPEVTTQQAQTAPTAESPTQTTFDPTSPPSTNLKPTPEPYPSPQTRTQLAQTTPTAQSATQSLFESTTPPSTTLKSTPSPPVTSQLTQTKSATQTPSDSISAPSTNIKPTIKPDPSHQTATKLPQTAPPAQSAPQSPPPAQSTTQPKPIVQDTSQATQATDSANSTTQVAKTFLDPSPQPDQSDKSNAHQDISTAFTPRLNFESQQNSETANTEKTRLQPASSTATSSPKTNSALLPSPEVNQDNPKTDKQDILRPDVGQKPEQSPQSNVTQTGKVPVTSSQPGTYGMQQKGRSERTDEQTVLELNVQSTKKPSSNGAEATTPQATSIVNSKTESEQSTLEPKKSTSSSSVQATPDIAQQTPKPAAANALTTIPPNLETRSTRAADSASSIASQPVSNESELRESKINKPATQAESTSELDKTSGSNKSSESTSKPDS